MDGAYIWRESKRAFFHKISGPSDHDIVNLLESIIEAVPTNLAKSIHDWIFLTIETLTAGFMVPPHPEARRSASGIRAFPVSI
jgi:hypothetical protein